MQRAAINQLSNGIALPSRSCIVQYRRTSQNIVTWYPGRESYATTDTTNRCLSLVWWRECLARCGGSLHRETHYRVAGSLRLVESVVPRLVEETFALRGLPAGPRLRRPFGGFFMRAYVVFTPIRSGPPLNSLNIPRRRPPSWRGTRWLRETAWCQAFCNRLTTSFRWWRRRISAAQQVLVKGRFAPEAAARETPAACSSPAADPHSRSRPSTSAVGAGSTIYLLRKSFRIVAIKQLSLSSTIMKVVFSPSGDLLAKVNTARRALAAQIEAFRVGSLASKKKIAATA